MLFAAVLNLLIFFIYPTRYKRDITLDGLMSLRNVQVKGVAQIVIIDLLVEGYALRRVGVDGNVEL